MPSSGERWGHYFLPEVGDQVLLAFDQGNIEKPYVIGCIPKDSNRFLTGSVDAENQYKKIMTKNGNAIIFEDNREGTGENDKIQITTPDMAHSITLDNQRKQIAIKDKDGKNQIVLKTEEGYMQVNAEKRLVINVGDTITVTMNGGNGTVTIECDKFNVKGGNGIIMESNASAKLSGSNVTVEATSALRANSNGTTTIQGTPIKIG